MARDVRERFGAAVRARRRALGISQEELGERAQLDRTYVSGVERGIRNPSLLIQQRLADALETRLSELVREDEV
jgi:transcriptional regulator with XRE-family HTH domain